jgi:hypothetical protein
MPLYLGTINYVGGSGSPAFPLPVGGSDNPTAYTNAQSQAGTLTAGSYLVAGNSGAAFWAYPGNVGVTIGGTFSTRSILTHGYMAGGYKNSNPWRNINKTWHATDVTVNMGEQLDRPFTYGGGTFSDYYGYVHGTCEVAVSSVLGNFTTANLASTHSSSYNLHTGLARTVSSMGGIGENNSSNVGWTGPEGTTGLGISTGAGWVNSGNTATTYYTGNDPQNQGLSYGTGSVILGVGNIEMTTARSYHAGGVDQTNQQGWITGGQQGATAVDRLNFPTEIMYAGPNACPVSSANSAVCAHGQTVGWWSFTGTKYYLTWATGAWTAWSTSQAWCTDGQSKFLSSKLGYHYGGTSSNATTGFGSWNDSTGATITNALSKPAAVGEEGYEMGQNWGYCIGSYNGVQNNYSFKVMYATGTMYVGGDAMCPKGHGGADAGTCSSAAASITAGAR